MNNNSQPIRTSLMTGKKHAPLIKLSVSQDFLQFNPISRNIHLKTSLTIIRKSGKFTTEKFKIDLTTQKTKDVNCFCFLGQLTLYGKAYVFYVQEADSVVRFNHHTIYQAKMVSAVQVKYVESNQSDPNYLIELDCVNSICKYFEQNLYFSHTYDLTLDLQTQLTKQQDLNEKIEKSYRFWWNFNMLRALIHHDINLEWCIRTIQGYVGGFRDRLKNLKDLDFILISRREWQRGGTRYNHRGLDNKDGNAANFVESETIIKYDSNLASHLQIRGSVPLLWQQSGLRSVVNLSAGNQTQLEGMKKHFTRICTYYGKVMCVNLMSKNKPNEETLSKTYSDGVEQIKQNNSDYFHNLRYQHLDFYQYCKHQNFKPLNIELSKYEETIKKWNFFLYNQKKGEVIQKQIGIIRTNCLDCLDRTNVFQNKIALITAEYIFTSLNIQTKNEFGCGTFLSISDELDLQPKIIRVIKKCWGENGDQISQVYCGTGATTTTKLTNGGGGGWSTFFTEGWKGIERLYQKTINDTSKQEIFGLIVQSQTIVDNKGVFDKLVNYSKEQMKQKNTISIQVITWNLEQTESEFKSFDMSKLMDSRNEQPDLVIIILNGIEQNQTQLWQQHFYQFLQNRKEKFEQVLQCPNNNMMTLIFAKLEIKQEIRKAKTVQHVVFSEKKKQGALISLLQLKDQTIGIVNCSLSSKSDKKLANLQQLMIETKYNSQDFTQQCDFVILSGNLNFIINMNQQFLQKTLDMTNKMNMNQHFDKKKIINDIYQQDEFLQFKQTLLGSFNESPIVEYPSTCISDSSDYAWPNRILYSFQEGCEFKVDSCRLQQHSPRVLYAQIFKKQLLQQIDESNIIQTTMIVPPEEFDEKYEDCLEQQIVQVQEYQTVDQNDDNEAMNMSRVFYAKPNIIEDDGEFNFQSSSSNDEF